MTFPINFVPSWRFLLAVATLSPLVLGHLKTLRLPFYKRQSFLESVLNVHGLKDLQLLLVARGHERGQEVGQLVARDSFEHPLKHDKMTWQVKIS